MYMCVSLAQMLVALICEGDTREQLSKYKERKLIRFLGANLSVSRRFI